MLDKKKRIAYYDEQADSIEKWRKRNRLYHRTLEKYCAFVIPEGSSVLEIGSGNGDLLNAVKPSRGVGIDFSEKMVALARKKYPHLEFLCLDGEQFSLAEKFDYYPVIRYFLHPCRYPGSSEMYQAIGQHAYAAGDFEL